MEEHQAVVNGTQRIMKKSEMKINSYLLRLHCERSSSRFTLIPIRSREERYEFHSLDALILFLEEQIDSAFPLQPDGHNVTGRQEPRVERCGKSQTRRKTY